MKTKIAFVFLFICATQTIFSRQEKSNEIIVFHNVNLLPMTSKGIVSGQTVVIKKDRIMEIGRSGKVKIPEGAIQRGDNSP